MIKSTSLEATAQALVGRGKGILAADESFPTIEKRFKELQIPSTEETRRDYREMLLTAPQLGDFISGVILFDETLRQKTREGTPMRAVLDRQGIIPGIKVDLGAVNLPNFPHEKFTLGLDGLRERLAEYRELGARFTKWRAVIDIGEGRPTHTALETNARALALFASLSQEAGLVPIVEPEVLMEGAHAIERCEAVTEQTLHSVFQALAAHKVVFEQMILKTGMVLSGEDSEQRPTISEVAAATLRCLTRTVPAAVPGIVFLSGGQGDEEATARLNAICSEKTSPWRISFSYGRAFQAPALKLWKGLNANIPAGQKALIHRARCNSLAVQGRYRSEMEKDA